MSDDLHEYVDMMVEVKDGKVISCEFHGEGRQAEPLTEPKFFMPVEDVVWPRGMERVARRITRALKKISTPDRC